MMSPENKVDAQAAVQTLEVTTTTGTAVTTGGVKKNSGRRSVALVVAILVATTGACAGGAYLGARFGNKKETRVIAACEGNTSCRVTYKDVDAALKNFTSRFNSASTHTTVKTEERDVLHVPPPDEQDPDEVHNEIIGASEDREEDSGGESDNGAANPAGNLTGFRTYELVSVDPNSTLGGPGGGGDGVMERGHFVETAFETDVETFNAILADLPDAADTESVVGDVGTAVSSTAFGRMRRALAGVIGYDGRKEVKCVTARSDPKYKVIAKITDPNGPKGCSGTLIGVDTILTAAHCVHTGPNGQYKWPSSVRFGACEGRQGFQYAPSSITVLSEYLDGRRTKADREDYDLAVIKVHGNPGLVWGSAGFGYSTSATSSIYNWVRITGYPCDKDWFDMWGMAGGAQVNGNRIEYKIDIFGCQSGSGVQSTAWSDMVVGVLAYADMPKNFGPKLRAGVYWIISMHEKRSICWGDKCSAGPVRAARWG